MQRWQKFILIRAERERERHHRGAWYYLASATHRPALLVGQTAEKRDEIWQAVTEAAKPYANSKGEVILDNEVICCTGTRPS